MSIQEIYDVTAKVYRLQNTESGDAGDEDYGVHINRVRCHIQPLDDSFSEDIQGQFGKDYILICDIHDILEGDKVEIGSDTYRVVGVESFSSDVAGGEAHLELRIREYNS